jgi:hypothetical protein
MAVEDEKTEENKRGRPPKIDLTQEICEKQELDTILGQLPSGYLILVHREEPQWCKGYLGKLYCDNENLDLDSIRDNFGGKVLSLRFVNAQGKMRGTKRVTFPDPPRRDGRIITEDEYSSRRPDVADAKSNSPGAGGFIPPGMPPHLAAQLAAFYAGFPLPPPAPAAPPTNPLDVMQAQQIMNLMNSQMVAQQELARANMAHMKEMEQIRRDAEDERERRRRRQDTDKEPLGELDTAIKLIRELNGIKSELGSTDTTSAIIQNTAPIIQDAVTELIDLYKMKAQAEIAQHTRREAPPLPARSLPAVSVAPQQYAPQPKPGNGKTDPVELAKQLRQFYDGLSPNEQTEVMQAFLGQSDEPAEYDQPEQILDPVIPEIHNESGSSVLSDADRRLLNEDIDLSDQDQEIQGGEYARATEDHDPDNRTSD